MILADFRDYLKTLKVAEHYSIGKINNSQEYSLGVYSMGNLLRRIEAVGLVSSYDVAGVNLLLHWNKNANETEAAARNLFEAIRYITDVDMGLTHVEYIDIQGSEPNFIGTDQNGVYEYTIHMNIYYRRR